MLVIFPALYLACWEQPWCFIRNLDKGHIDKEQEKTAENGPEISWVACFQAILRRKEAREKYRAFGCTVGLWTLGRITMDAEHAGSDDTC
jgi:hypothetical protein